MRRLVALTLAVGVAWLAVRPGDFGSSAALAFGLALVAASTVGWLFQFLRLPRITGYVILGLLCGPSMANIITQAMARDLRAANGLAVAIIAFLAGLQLSYPRIKSVLPSAVITGAAAMATALVLVAAALVVGWPWLHIDGAMTTGGRVAAAALGATLLAGFSPMITSAVVAEGRARGRLTDFVVTASVTSELIALTLFGIVLLAVRLVLHAPPAIGTLAAETLWQIVGSLAFGAVVGSLFALYVKLIGRETTLVLLALGAVLMGLGARLECQPLLAGLAAGLVVQHVMPAAADALRDGIERGAMPILVIFFAAAGASMRVDALSTIGALALATYAVRTIGMWIGARAGAKIAGADGSTALAWRAFLTTAGMAVAAAATVSAEFDTWGPRLEMLVLGVIALSEIAGPIATRAALTQNKEIGRSTGGLVVVSNREPWIHEFAPDGTIQVRSTPGGVGVALDALMRERGGVWIAHGAGTADRAVVDERQSVDVPPDAPAYRLRRLWLTPKEEEGYYAGFANSALWPLCHQAHVRPVFKAEDWDMYQAVNEKFAETAAVEAPPDSSVFLNDYHLALTARTLRHRRPFLRTALFWHIPWPDVDRLRICPWRKEIVEGLLHNDLVAFQLQRDQKHFLEAVASEVGASVSGETVYFDDRQVRVLSIPIGADFDRISEILADPALPGEIARLQHELKLQDRVVGIGVDRLDYTKGIPERLSAIANVLEAQPALRDKFAFVQIGVPSRQEVPGYAEISAAIDAQVAHINATYGRSAEDGPIRHLKQGFPLPELVALYRLADFCIVSSLHDGMNLVAKEFVAARDDLDGVLILSELAGAAQELAEALIINPYDERGFAEAVSRAIEMPSWERRRRMQALRRRVAGRDVLAWASDILDRLERRKGQGFLSG